MLPRIAPNTAVEIPCEDPVGETGDNDGEGAAAEDPSDELDSALDEVLDCTAERDEEEEGGGVVRGGVDVDVEGIAGEVGSGVTVGGGVNPPYVHIPSVPRGI